MLSGRVDKASIDSEIKLSMACVWPESKKEDESHKGKENEKESKRGQKNEKQN